MAAIQKRSLVDQVYERLRNDIITLQLPLGSRINVNELQDTLGVSCTPIREAINRLQQEGLITYENNVGARVLSLEAKDVEDIQLLATTLHCAAAKLAMDRGDHAVMAELLHKQAERFEAANDPDAQVDAVHHFIEVFYKHCGNRRLDRSMLSIQGQQLIIRNLYARHGMDRTADAADFRRICKGVEDGDSNEVYLAIRANAARLEQAVIKSLESP
jgi:DNA-binding GntR family transcriptional regulator